MRLIGNGRVGETRHFPLRQVKCLSAGRCWIWHLPYGTEARCSGRPLTSSSSTPRQNRFFVVTLPSAVFVVPGRGQKILKRLEGHII